MLASAASAQVATPTPDIAASDIVVTAQKRSESIKDVPVPVTVVSGETLLKNNELRLQDYYEKIPGLIVSTGDALLTPTISLRGLTTGGSNTPILGVDRFMSECRSLTNFVGNAVATIVVARWEGALDRERLRAALAGEPLPAAEPGMADSTV